MQQPKKTYKKGMQDRNNQASKHRISLRERHIYNLNRQNAKMFRYVQIWISEVELDVHPKPLQDAPSLPSIAAHWSANFSLT